MNELLCHAAPLSIAMLRVLAAAPWATVEMVEDAWRGDPSDLLTALHNPDRPIVIDWLLGERQFTTARTALRNVWDHDYQYCLNQWGLRGTIERLELTRQ